MHHPRFRPLLRLRTPPSAVQEDDSHPAFARHVGRQDHGDHGRGKPHKETETSTVVSSTSIASRRPLPPTSQSTSESPSSTPPERSSLSVSTTPTTTSISATSTTFTIAPDFSFSEPLVASADVAAITDASDVPTASTSASTDAARAPSVNASAIAGAVIVIALVGLGLAVMLYMRRRRKRNEDQDDFDENLFKRQSSIIGDHHHYDTSRPPSMLEPPMDNLPAASYTQPEPYDIADYFTHADSYGPHAVTQPFDAGQVTSTVSPVPESTGQFFASQGQPSVGALSVPPHDTQYNTSGYVVRQPSHIDHEISFSPKTEQPLPSLPGSGSLHHVDERFWDLNDFPPVPNSTGLHAGYSKQAEAH